MNNENDDLVLSYPLAWEKMDEYSKRIHRKNYDKIRQSMRDVGISFRVENGEIYIYLSQESYQKKKNRNAGAKQKCLTEHMTVREIRERMTAGETADQIAKRLGISRPTLFRRLKKAENEHRETL